MRSGGRLSCAWHRGSTLARAPRPAEATPRYAAVVSLKRSLPFGRDGGASVLVFLSASTFPIIALTDKDENVWRVLVAVAAVIRR